MTVEHTVTNNQWHEAYKAGQQAALTGQAPPVYHEGAIDRVSYPIPANQELQLASEIGYRQAFDPFASTPIGVLVVALIASLMFLVGNASQVKAESYCQGLPESFNIVGENWYTDYCYTELTADGRYLVHLGWYTNDNAGRGVATWEQINTAISELGISVIHYNGLNYFAVESDCPIARGDEYAIDLDYYLPPEAAHTNSFNWYFGPEGNYHTFTPDDRKEGY